MIRIMVRFAKEAECVIVSIGTAVSWVFTTLRCKTKLFDGYDCCNHHLQWKH